MDVPRAMHSNALSGTSLHLRALHHSAVDACAQLRLVRSWAARSGMMHPLTGKRPPPTCFGGTPTGGSPCFLSQNFDQTTSSVLASAMRALPAACMVVTSEEMIVPSLLNADDMIGTMNVRPRTLRPACVAPVVQFTTYPLPPA